VLEASDNHIRVIGLIDRGYPGVPEKGEVRQHSALMQEVEAKGGVESSKLKSLLKHRFI
jgi:hypothetical protein